jgi:diaminopimelate decarboxylase
MRAGADPRKIVFSGVGKTDEEIEAALKARILMIDVESRPELEPLHALVLKLIIEPGRGISTSGVSAAPKLGRVHRFLKDPARGAASPGFSKST